MRDDLALTINDVFASGLELKDRLNRGEDYTGKAIDAPTAMATSMKLVWNNFQPMVTWGAMVLALFVLCVATGLVGMIVIFPLLGHATWHAYRAVALAEGKP